MIFDENEKDNIFHDISFVEASLKKAGFVKREIEEHEKKSKRENNNIGEIL